MTVVHTNIPLTDSNIAFVDVLSRNVSDTAARFRLVDEVRLTLADVVH